MLPSVGAGNAAHRIYAQAVAAATPDTGARSAPDPVRRDGNAPARGGEQAAPEAQADEAAVVRDSKAAVEALLDLLHARVLAALTEAGLAAPVATAAADEAAAMLANAIATDSRHAAQIVHAVTEKLLAGEDFAAPALLHLAARGLTVVVDPALGNPRVALDALEIAPPEGVDPAPHHHLVDFTDGHSDDAAPILRVLAEVRETALAAVRRDPAAAGETAARRAAALPQAIVAPGVFAEALRGKIAPELVAQGYPAEAAGPYANAVSRLLVAALAQAETPHGFGTLAAAHEAISRLSPAGEPAAAPAAAPAESGAGAAPAASAAGRIVLASGPLAVVVAPRDGAITVRIANQAVAVAPASLAPATAWIAPLADVDALPLPEIPGARRAASPVSVEAAVPLPAVAGLPAHAARNPAADEADGPAKPDVDTAKAAAAALDAETIRLIETAVARNATLFRALLAAPSDGAPGRMRISLDIGAYVGAAPPVPVDTARLGRFGLPHHAPTQGEKGPVHADGHEDATATKPPVVPAWHALGEMPRLTGHKLPKPESRHRKLSYRNDAHAEADADALPTPDDAFTRDMPEGFEGLVVKSVKVSA